MGSSSMFAVETLHLPVENVLAKLKRDEFSLSGSVVEMQVDPSHPVMAGMPDRAKVMSDGGPVFTVTDAFEGSVLAKYQTVGSPLLSGYLLGEEHIQGFATALDVQHGDGHVILLGMRPQWRGQPFGTFKILFNAAMYTQQIAATLQKNEDFWVRPEPKEEEEGDEEKDGGNENE